MELPTMEKGVYQLTKTNPNAVRAWIFFNNIIISLAKDNAVTKEQRTLLYEELPKAFGEIKDFSIYSHEKIEKCIKKDAQDSLTIDKRQITFLCQLLQSKTLLEVLCANWSSRLSARLATRLTNLAKIDDKSLSKHINLFYLYTSDELVLKGIYINNLRKGSFIELSQNIYLSNIPFGINESDYMNLISDLLDPGHGTDQKIGVVLTIGPSINQEAFIKWINKNGHEAVNAMKSFYKPDEEYYDSRFAAIQSNNTYNTDKVFFKIIDNSSEKYKKTGTLKIYNLHTDEGREGGIIPNSAVLTRIWYLSQIHNICIQVSDVKSSKCLSSAGFVALAICLVNKWVYQSWPTTGEELKKQLIAICQENPSAAKLIFANEDKSALERFFRDVCTIAFDGIYISTKAHGKTIDNSMVISAEQLEGLYKEFSKTNVDDSITYIENYIFKKEKDSRKKTSVASKKIASFLGKNKSNKDDFQLINKTAHYKLELMRIFVDFYKTEVKGKLSISIRTLLHLHTLLTALLQDAVMYEERKKGGLIAQGNAIDALKKSWTTVDSIVNHVLQQKQIQLIEDQLAEIKNLNNCIEEITKMLKLPLNKQEKKIEEPSTVVKERKDSTAKQLSESMKQVTDHSTSLSIPVDSLNSDKALEELNSALNELTEINSTF